MTQTNLPYCGPAPYAPSEEVNAQRSEVEALLRKIPGVEGLGEGQDSTGDSAWIVYVRDRSVADRVPARLRGRSVVVEVSGEIDVLPA